MKAPTAPRRRPDEETLTWLNQSTRQFYPKHRTIPLVADHIFKGQINDYQVIDVLRNLGLKCSKKFVR